MSATLFAMTLEMPQAPAAPQPMGAALVRGSAPSGVQAALRREDRDRVRRAIARLPIRERETVWLRLYHGLNGRETAARLGVDESTVSVRMRRALEACARWLDDRDA